MRAVLAVAAAGLVLSACSSPVQGTPANAKVCRHYLTQRSWVKGLTQPTFKDVTQFVTDVAADYGQSSGQLHTDLGAMLTAVQAGRSDYGASTRVYNDCT